MRTDERARFKKIGPAGDKALSSKTASIAGLGGMGTAAASILARENIDLRLIDKGRVEEEDMHRLSLFYEEDITKFKVKQAKARLNAINPLVQVKSFHEEISTSNLFLLDADVIVDTSNNTTINALTVGFATSKKIPLVLSRCSGSTIRVLVLQKKAPAKLLEKINLPGLSTSGVFSPATTITGSLVAGEVMKVLLGEKGNYIVEADAWDHKMKVRKL